MAYSHYGDKNTMLQRLNQIKHTGNSSMIAKGALLIFAAGMLSSVAIAKQPAAKTEKQSIAPILRIEPLYPTQAAEQGISGSVVLKYDIDPAGNTANVSVVNAKPDNVFNKEAKRALKQWQYKPSDSGFKDVLVQLDFAIDKYLKDPKASALYKPLALAFSVLNYKHTTIIATALPNPTNHTNERSTSKFR